MVNVFVFIKVKTGPFFEHSNTLWGISSVPTWTKVNSGLLKMYKAEVWNTLYKLLFSFVQDKGVEKTLIKTLA